MYLGILLNQTSHSKTQDVLLSGGPLGGQSCPVVEETAQYFLPPCVGVGDGLIRCLRSLCPGPALFYYLRVF